MVMMAMVMMAMMMPVMVAVFVVRVFIGRVFIVFVLGFGFLRILCALGQILRLFFGLPFGFRGFGMVVFGHVKAPFQRLKPAQVFGAHESTTFARCVQAFLSQLVPRLLFGEGLFAWEWFFEHQGVNMRRCIWLLSGLAFAGMWGCGGTALTGSSEGGGTGGAGGVGGGSGGFSGTCPAPDVFEARIDFFGMSVANNCELSLPGGQPGAVWTGEGVLNKTGAEAFQLDGCPQKNCESPILFDIQLSTKGVEPHIPDGTYVRLRYEALKSGDGCSYSFEIYNLAAIDGMPPNPTELGEGLWFYGMAYGSGDSAPVKFAWTGNAFCSPIANSMWPYGRPVRLEAADDASKTLTLGMGEMQVWDIQTPLLPGIFDAKNLASIIISETAADISFVVSRRVSAAP